MTDYTAYDAGMPCKNPACKSYGKPHPNCRCYAHLAEGGDVHFCASERPHEPGCEYFAEGGDAALPDGYEIESWPPSELAAPEGHQSPEPADDSIVGKIRAALPGKMSLSAKQGIPHGLAEEDQAAPASGVPPGYEVELQPNIPKGYEPEVGKYETPGQQAGALAEGVAQGLAGPLATGAELGLSKLGVPGISAEDIRGRADANPMTHGAGEVGAIAAGLYFGTGEGALAAKAGRAAEALPMVSKLAAMGTIGKIASGFIGGAIQNGLIQFSDNVSNWMLDQNCDPQDPVGCALGHAGSNILFSSLFGGAFGAAGGVARKAAADEAATLVEQKLGDKGASWLAGAGAALNPEDAAAFESAVKLEGAAPTARQRLANDSTGIPQFNRQAFDAGKDYINKYKDYATNVAGGAVSGIVAAEISPLAAPVAFFAKPIIDWGVNKGSAKVLAPLTLKMLQSGNFRGAMTALQYQETVAKGASVIDKLLEGTFAGSAAGIEQMLNSYGNAEAREELRDKIAEGGLGADLQEGMYQQKQQPEIPQYAKGGEVKATEAGAEPANGVGIHFPKQNFLVNAAKGRISNYLNSIRPVPTPSQLPFDAAPDQTEKKRAYDKALDLAHQPLGILQEIKNGTLEPDHIKHVKAMYPETDQYLQKEITKKVLKAQLDGKTPPFHVQQGLSMYSGAALSSDFQAQNMLAAQAVFQGQKQAAQQQGGAPAPAKKKRSTAPLSNSDQSFLTSSQSRDGRSQRAR